MVCRRLRPKWAAGRLVGPPVEFKSHTVWVDFVLTYTDQLDTERIIVAGRLIAVPLVSDKTRCLRQGLAETLPASVQFFSEYGQCKLAESEHPRNERPKDEGRRPRVDSLQPHDGSEAGR